MSPHRSACTHIRGALLILPFLVQLFITDIVLSLLLPLSVLLPTAVYDTSSRLAFFVWAHIQHIFTTANGAHITITYGGDGNDDIVNGTGLPVGESAIVVANHVAWTDFYMIQALALRAGMLGRCRWFAKSQLRWVPFLGWGLWAMGMPLVTRDWTHDRREMDRVFGGIRRNRWPICMSPLSFLPTCCSPWCLHCGAVTPDFVVAIFLRGIKRERVGG